MIGLLVLLSLVVVSVITAAAYCYSDDAAREIDGRVCWDSGDRKWYADLDGDDLAGPFATCAEAESAVRAHLAPVYADREKQRSAIGTKYAETLRRIA